MSNDTAIKLRYEKLKIRQIPESQVQKKGVETLGSVKVYQRIFICAGRTIPKSCFQQDSLESWEYPRKRLPELKLDRPQEDQTSGLAIAEASYLRVYCSSPIMVVYPDSIWYCYAIPDLIRRITQEHLIGNKVVQEYVFLTHPLPEMSQVAGEQLLKA